MKQLSELLALIDHLKSEGKSAAFIIQTLAAGHGAKFSTTICNGHIYRLSAAGVTSSCTWSRDVGLLENWERNAERRLGLQPGSRP